MNNAPFNTVSRTHVPIPLPSSLYDPGGHEGQDERDSVSSSDDGNYIYHDAKGDFDPDEDYTALTSQTLNTDGTPKRPMNAFMIFARKRRPQVSAENQAMRTGEISKILSKEWNNMETSQKQFYQEQARLLKDSFNLKYPDYVYRRRPNNTRRKRKPDAPGQRPPDTHPSFGEDVAFDDAGDFPTERDDFHSSEVVSDIHRTRLGHDMHLNDHSKLRHAINRASPYPYPSLDPRSSSGHENHFLYEPVISEDHVLQDESLEQSPCFSYVSAQSHGRAQTQSMLIFPQNSLNNNDGNWNPSSTRSSSWLGPESQSRNFSLSALKTHRSAQPPGNAHSSPPLTMPTLSSPFFPNDPPQQLSPAGLTHSISPSYNPNHLPSPILIGREFGQHDVSVSSISPNTSQLYPNAERNINVNGLMYAPGPQRQSGGPRGLPLISDYSQLGLESQPPFPPHSNLNSQQGYWPKD
ncbi:hypothetical protein E4T56_gene13496 [Termitomyces sp. T112]|nr:hypothetical protein E4T56_gene13496 [Termitomyces sp. T112]